MSRRILVTGTSRGIGRALAEHFLAQGDLVVGCARGATDLEHERYRHVAADVTEEESVKDLFRAVRDHMAGLDGLVNNAGTARMAPMMLTPAAAAARVLDVNFTGVFRLSREAVRLLRRSRAGRIVNLTTVAVPLRLEGEAVYAASKSAVETFTRIVARELGPLGVTCNALGPSPIRTDLIRGISEDKLQELIDRQSIPRWAEPADVVNAIEFFLSPASGMITGQVIYLGGLG
ncbi:MAG: SDR family oxidoreductase [Pseudomonadales bacterium]|jgi:3-oxoacyl-[acyl-carrier protein] reductase|nr:SDR family oxidoreductase [Pseudomonadales bacterium]